MASSSLEVHVAYATATEEILRTLTVAQGTTIAQAIELSGLMAEIAGMDLATRPVGLYGKKRPLDTVLREQDRIEIYRPLLADPKDARRKRAERNKAPPA